MSAWTWTHIKVNVINREQGLKYCELAENDMNSIWYYENWIKDPDTALSKWKQFQLKNKKYFIEECNVPESHFTDAYIKNEYENKTIPAEIISLHDLKRRPYDDVRVNQRKWVLFNYPSLIDAYKAHMSLDEFKKYAFEVMNVDYSLMMHY